jgi:hypothetical protein
MCEHKYVHIESIRSYERGGYNTTWIVIDRFFCEKCGMVFEKRKEETCRNQPEWY